MRSNLQVNSIPTSVTWFIVQILQNYKEKRKAENKI